MSSVGMYGDTSQATLALCAGMMTRPFFTFATYLAPATDDRERPAFRSPLLDSYQ